MRDHPPGEEVIIVGCAQRDAPQPSFVRKGVDKGLVLQDMSPKCRSAAGEAGDTTIDMRGCSNFEITTLEIESSEYVPEARVDDTKKTLASTGATDLTILERRQKILE